MSRLSLLLLMLVISALIFGGCSSLKEIPTMPGETNSDLSLPVPDVDPYLTNRTLLGTWIVNLDTEKMTATIEPSRTVYQTHGNFTAYVPKVITPKSWDPVTMIATYDIKLTNATTNIAYDPRLIVYTDKIGHKLVNADDWTPLWDISGGMQINPFVVYAKTSPNRSAPPYSYQTRTLQIRCPGGNTSFQLAVDACLPPEPLELGNCEEPYEILNFIQEHPVYHYLGSRTKLYVDVKDWQNDASFVALYCPQITGVALAPFARKTGDTWYLHLANNMAAPAGMYTGYLLAGSNNSGLLYLYDEVTIEVQDGGGVPDNPHEVGWENVKCTRSRKVAIKDNDAYVADGTNGLRIIDISNPITPVFRGEVDTPGEAFDISIQGDYSFIADWGGGLQVIDISDPTQPFIAGSVKHHQIDKIETRGNYAYCSGYNNDCLEVIDISNPILPVHKKDLEFSGANGLAVDGDYAYFAAAGNGLKVIRILDPLNPVIVGGVDTNGDARDITKSGDFVYIADMSKGLKKIDVSDPANPVIVGANETFNCCDVDIEGNFAYCCTESANIKIVDISNPPNLTISYTVTLGAGASQGNVVIGNYDYVAAWTGGLRIVQLW